MKKTNLLAILVAALFAACLLAGCASGGDDNPDSGSSGDAFELALITDIGTIDDKSFNQGSWEGLKKYADEFNKTHKYYQPAAKDNTAYLDAIDLAVKGGAKVIVTPGFLFEVPIYLAQDMYPDVKFILLDGSPNDGDWDNGPDFKTGANTVGVTYAEQEAGFLAGYAAVIDGYRNLGFMGGMAVPAVKKFGYGFIQGAEYAGAELGLGAGDIAIRYHYTGDFIATPEIETMSSAWYNDGVEVIFACGGAVGNSVMAAAEKAGMKVIGVDIDQSSESATVITSAMKELAVSVYDCLKDYYAGNFPGGKNITFTAANYGVGLPMSTSKFETFKQSDYDIVFAKLQDGAVDIWGDMRNGADVSVSDIPKSIVIVNEIA
ncbi:MAG: BMP family ABC transporter substrate-binding protein [Oscillospiraceae bacterium]|jgi:basic membrane protein A|nr:BMP family ABC transporter substrate-binding protein [Oscillospiraceae bacterium]